MKYAGKMVLIVLAGMFVTACTINKPAEKVRTVTVNGTGSVSVSPDSAVLSFSVTTSGWSAKQIVTDNGTIAGRFVTAAVAAGVNENDIFQSECTVSNPGNNYEARRTVTVTVRNLSIVPAVIDCKSASMKLTSVEYTYADSASEIRRARTAAVQNAQDAASLLAGASGSKTGDVVSITNESVTKTSERDGTIKIQSNLTVTYDLQ